MKVISFTQYNISFLHQTLTASKSQIVYISPIIKIKS